MKFKATLVFLLITASVTAQSIHTFNPDDLESIARGESRTMARYLRPQHSIPTSAFDVTFYRCFWEMDPAVRYIEGSVTIQFKPLQPLFDSLVLDMSDSLILVAVSYHGSPLTAAYHSNNQVVVKFPSVIPQGTTDSVLVSYKGIPLQDDWGTFETGEHAGVPMMFTLSEPYGASNWWPCRNDLTDKADSVQIIVRCPSAYTASTNGILEKTENQGSKRIFYYKHRYPIATYLVCLAVTNYTEYQQLITFGNDTLKQINYLYPEDSAAAVPKIQATAGIMKLFDSLFGIYPFQAEKYGQTQFGWGGGMEHQTNTFLANFEFELLSHELAHQWFGDMVTCGSWTDIWLNEGFATYLSGLSYEFIMPEFWQRFRQVRIQKITSAPGGSVYCTDTTSIFRLFDTRLSYAKGCMILHQLRWIMGDQAFFQSLNEYLYDPFLAYGFVRTSDLREHMEAVYGKDLGWYFDQWYTGEGYPSYHADWGQTGDTLRFTLSQTASTSTIPFFSLPVQIEFKNAVHDTLIIFDNSWSGQAYAVKLPWKADSLIIDPHYQIITKNNTVNAVPEEELSPVVSFGPNPASDHIVFRFGQGWIHEGSLFTVYGCDGRAVCSVPVSGGELRVETSRYSGGLYFWLLEDPVHRLSGKFLIRRP